MDSYFGQIHVINTYLPYRGAKSSVQLCNPYMQFHESCIQLVTVCPRERVCKNMKGTIIHSIIIWLAL